MRGGGQQDSSEKTGVTQRRFGLQYLLLHKGRVHNVVSITILASILDFLEKFSQLPGRRCGFVRRILAK